jgi:hypothetical protein
VLAGAGLGLGFPTSPPARYIAAIFREGTLPSIAPLRVAGSSTLPQKRTAIQPLSEESLWNPIVFGAASSSSRSRA